MSNPESNQENKLEKEKEISVQEFKIGKTTEIDVVGNNDQSYEKNYQEMSRFAAESMADAIERANADPKKKRIVLGLAADTSPIGMYEEFAKIVKERELDLSKVFVVRYEQGYGPLVKSGSDIDFDEFHRQMFFEPNGIEAVPAQVVEANGESKVEGNFLTMFLDYQGKEDQHKIKELTEKMEAVMKIVGKMDFAVMGMGKDGHIIDWGRFEHTFKIRTSREKTPTDYDVDYQRFPEEEDYRNYMWRDILKLGESFGVSAEEAEKGLLTTATLGIRHIVGAQEAVIIAPQETKARAVKEAVMGSFDGEVKLGDGEKAGSVKRDKKLRNPAGSVLRIRDALGNKSSKLVLTPDSAQELPFVKK